MTDEWSAAAEAPGEPPAPPPAPAEQPVKRGRGRPTGPSLRKLLTQKFPDGASMNDLVNAGYGDEFKRHLDTGEVEMNAEGVYRWVGKVVTESTVPPEEPAGNAKLAGVIADPENLPFHALAGIFPMMTPAELNDLTEDVREHGLRDPIEIYNGQIVEGRNRFVACKAAEVPPEVHRTGAAERCGSTCLRDPEELKRRHLDESQRAMVAK
jgi:hypothetical protein